MKKNNLETTTVKDCKKEALYHCNDVRSSSTHSIKNGETMMAFILQITSIFERKTIPLCVFSQKIFQAIIYIPCEFRSHWRQNIWAMRFILNAHHIPCFINYIRESTKKWKLDYYSIVPIFRTRVGKFPTFLSLFFSICQSYNKQQYFSSFKYDLGLR